MLWLIMNNCDFETALKQQLIERTFFPEYIFYYMYITIHLLFLKILWKFYSLAYLGPPRPGMESFAVQIDRKPSPRIIKTHLPFYLMHPKLLETAKVNRLRLLSLCLRLHLIILISFERWYMWLATQRIASFPSISIINWSNCKDLRAQSMSSLNISLTMRVNFFKN